MPTLAELIAERDRRRAAAAAASGGTAPEAPPPSGGSMESLIAERERRRAAQTAPEQTPWGDGQAFDDMYARKPQTDPMNLPLMPGARTLTSGQPTRMKPPPAPRGPVMSPAQRRVTQPDRDEAARVRKYNEELALMNAASPIPFKNTGPDGPLELNQERPDRFAGRATGAFVNSNIGVANTLGQFGLSTANAYGAAGDPSMQGALAGGEYGDITQRVADAAQQGGYVQNQQAVGDIIPSLPIPAATTPGEMLADVTGYGASIFTGFGAPILKGGKVLNESLATVPGISRALRGVGVETGENAALAYGLSAGAAPAGSDRNMAGTQGAADPFNYVSIEAARAVPRALKALDAPLTPTNAGGANLRPVVPQAPPVAPVVAATQAPTQPQIATAPPVPPIPPSAPAATAGAAQPIQPATAVSSLGEAEVWYNALPQKTRESILRTMTSSGVRDRADQFAIIADLNSLPPGRNSQNAFLVSQKWGERYPSLRENLLNMGGEFSAANPRANDQKVLGVFGKGRDDRAQALMDTEGRKQVVSERGFLERSAETNFGKPSSEVAQQLKDELSGLGKRYTTLLDPTRRRQFKDPTKIAGLQEAESSLKEYLKQPWIIENMPEAVRNRLMVDASDEIRQLGWSAEDLRTMAGPTRQMLAPLFEASGPLPWSPKMWEAIAEQYPRFAAHVLQSSYAKTARDMSRGVNAADNVGTIGQLGRMRGMDRDGNVIAGGLLDRLEKTMPNSAFSSTGAGSYADARVNYGDVKGAQEALKELENFKTAAQRGENVADIIEKMGNWSPRQKEAALSQITAYVQDSMGAKVRNVTPGQVGMAAETAPNLTQLGNDNFLAALRKVFGDQGDALANDIELARSSTTLNTDMNRRIGPNTQLKQENVRNAPRAYEDPAGLEGNVVDSTVKLAGAAGLGAAATGQMGAAAMLAGTAVLQAAWNGFKRGRRLNNTERSLLADFFFRSREAGLDGEALLARAGGAPPPSPNLPSPAGYAGNVAFGAGAGAAGGAFGSGGDPDTTLQGMMIGAVGGGARALQRSARAKSSIIKPRPANGLRNGPASPPAGPRPLPGQTSPSSPVIGGAALGALTSGGATYAATGDEDAALKAGILGGIGGGVVGNRLAKGAKPKAPPAPGFDQRFMKEAQRIVQYNGGVKPAVKAQQYVIDQLVKNNASQDRINKAVSVRSAIERMAERSSRELDEISATAPRSGPPGVKPPPVKMGFGGRDLPMDERSGSLIEADAISRIASGKSVPTSAELDDALKGLREAEFADLVRQFGGDRQKAEKFRSLWRQAENAPTRQEADMLDAQRQKLIEGMPDVEPREFVDEYALRQLRDAFRDIENGNAVKALNDSMTDLPTLREVQDGKISSRAQAALAILRKATQEARLQGADPKQMMNSALENYGRRFSDPVDAEFMVGEVKKLFATFDPSQSQSSKLLAGMSGNSRGIADNLKQDAALAAFGSVGGSFANQDDPQAGALGGMGIALGAKYVPRAVNAMRGAGRVKPPPVRGADQAGIKAYHGSPHDFDKFDSSKIGSGEGNQSYGRGLYFAENEAVAKDYRNTLGSFQQDAASIFKKHGAVDATAEDFPHLAKIAIHGSSMPEEKALFSAVPATRDLTPAQRQAMIDDYRAIKKPGRLYEVDIDADHKDFLDWDQRVTRKLEVGRAGDGKAAWYAGDELELMVNNDQALYAQRDTLIPLIKKYRRDPDNATLRRPIERAFKRASPDYGLKEIEDKFWPTLGDDFKRMEIEKGAEAAQQWARDQGFKGVKFLDQGSRNAGDGTRNYVVFDDSAVNIINKQGFGFGSGKAESRPKPPPKGQIGNALAGKPPKGPPKKPAPPKKAEEVALINALKKARANETASRRRNVMRDNRDELNSVAEEAVMQAERDLLEYRDRQFRQAAEGARWMDRGAAVANVGKKAAVATGNQIKKTMMKNDAELLKTYGVAVGGIAGIALGARALAGPDGDDDKKQEVLPPTDKRYFVETKLKKRPEMLGPVQNALVELGMLDVIDADTKWGTKTRDAIEAYLSRKPDRLPNLPIQDYEVPALMAEAYGGYQENGKWFYNTGEPIVYPPKRNDTYLPARPLRPDEARRMAYDKRTEAERNNKLRP